MNTTKEDPSQDVVACGKYTIKILVHEERGDVEAMGGLDLNCERDDISQSTSESKYPCIERRTWMRRRSMERGRGHVTRTVSENVSMKSDIRSPKSFASRLKVRGPFLQKSFDTTHRRQNYKQKQLIQATIPVKSSKKNEFIDIVQVPETISVGQTKIAEVEQHYETKDKIDPPSPTGVASLDEASILSDATAFDSLPSEGITGIERILTRSFGTNYDQEDSDDDNSSTTSKSSAESDKEGLQNSGSPNIEQTETKESQISEMSANSSSTCNDDRNPSYMDDDDDDDQGSLSYSEEADAEDIFTDDDNDDEGDNFTNDEYSDEDEYESDEGDQYDDLDRTSYSQDTGPEMLPPQVVVDNEDGDDTVKPVLQEIGKESSVKQDQQTQDHESSPVEMFQYKDGRYLIVI
jgi:hypothetical protein